MNALQILIIALLLGDAFLESQLKAAGATKTEVIDGGGDRTTAQYPRIIISVWGGKQQKFSDDYDDDEDDLYIENGRVQLEFVCQKGAACPEPLKTVRAIAAHVQDILLGRKSKSLKGVEGRTFSDGSGSYTCLEMKQVSPTGGLPAGVGYERHQITFDVQIQRLEE